MSTNGGWWTFLGHRVNSLIIIIIFETGSSYVGQLASIPYVAQAGLKQ
jgi:hypothetical protein